VKPEDFINQYREWYHHSPGPVVLESFKRLHPQPVKLEPDVIPEDFWPEPDQEPEPVLPKIEIVVGG
jgi:hypothetical protein